MPKRTSLERIVAALGQKQEKEKNSTPRTVKPVDRSDETSVAYPIEVKRTYYMGGKGGHQKYPWHHLEVSTTLAGGVLEGQSFFIANKDMRHMQSQAGIAGKRLGMKFVIRKEGNGVRVFRVK